MTQLDKKPERSHEIDLLRGAACASVVLFHFLYRGQQDDWITDRVGPLLSEIARYGYLGVDLFFIISGYVVFSSAQGVSVRGFVASRVARLYPAYWVAVCMTAGLAWALASPLFSVSPRDVLINLTMLMHLLPLRLGVELVDGAYWSLAVELQFYLLTVVVLWTGTMARIEGLLAGWLLLSLVVFVRRMYLPTLWLALDWAALATGCLGADADGRSADLPGVSVAPEHRLHAARRLARVRAVPADPSDGRVAGGLWRRLDAACGGGAALRATAAPLD